MQIKTIYRYVREDGGVTITTERPAANYTICYRLVADQGYRLTHNDTDVYEVIDVDSTSGWHEVPYQETERELFLHAD